MNIRIQAPTVEMTMALTQKFAIIDIWTVTPQTFAYGGVAGSGPQSRRSFNMKAMRVDTEARETKCCVAT